MEHLIANSGIHFITKEVEFNPSEPLILDNGRPLKYSFCEYVDFLENIKVFDLLHYNNTKSVFIPVNELYAISDGVSRRNNGREVIDITGMVEMNPEKDSDFFTNYTDESEEMFNINKLDSFRVRDEENPRMQVSAFSLLLDKWLPMPMFRREIDGVSSNVPLAWCRVKIMEIGEGQKKGYMRYRLVWAFDTATAQDELDLFRPFIDTEIEKSAEFALCNKADLLLEFMSSSTDFHAFSDYIAALLNIDLTKEHDNRYKAFYIYFINFIRLSGASPEVTLHDNKEKDIYVDLVLDIGNSRTCGVVFEESKFTRGKMLALTDLTQPWIEYENKTYDMRIVFRKADFGNDIVLKEDMFQWKSFVRIGEEAKRLIYNQSLENDGLSEKTTNYSSPKRYLWDEKLYSGQWENLTTVDDPYNVKLSNNVAIPKLSDMFNDDGSFNGEGYKFEEGLELIDFDKKDCHFSRASLMTFAFIELFQHAIVQINSIKMREKWGNIDCRRYIKNVIITCPTAMPLKEQIKLRQCAKDAFEAVTKCNPCIPEATIIPSAETLKNLDDYAEPGKRVWSYDEASCCQLVYLYAEIAQRYSGEIYKFFQHKGHVRPELKEEGYEGKALTIGSVDIGAGTTDVMVCAYECEGQGQARITPKPLFWDSFYLAGDDILKALIQNIVIEGKEHPHTDRGNILYALINRIVAKSAAELRMIPRCSYEKVYRDKIDEIERALDDDERRMKKVEFAANLVHDFFGKDSSMKSYRDYRCRTDFNTQISMPIAQLMMELLRTHRPSRLYTFDEIFPNMKPSEYLLDHFEFHFGFRFEELSWRFDPEEVSNIIKAVMEPLMKQLALVMYKHHCDIIVLAGRPSSLDPITELFIKYVPTPPSRLVRLNEYRVGAFYPTADGQGNFYDQKSIVAVGAMVGFLASGVGIKGLVLDFERMIKDMKSTANYIGVYKPKNQQVAEAVLTPQKSTATLKVAVFPEFLGCRQFNSSIYQARPLYAIYTNGSRTSLQITLSRNFFENREEVTVDEVTDNDGNSLPKNTITLVQQSLVDDEYWLDNGQFELSIK